MFLDFHSTKDGLSFITAWDQSMVERGVTEGGKNTASFLFREWTQQHKHEASG